MCVALQAAWAVRACVWVPQLLCAEWLQCREQQRDSAAGCLSSTHHEPDSAAALLHCFHGVLHLKQAPLRAPCGDIRVILHASEGHGA